MTTHIEKIEKAVRDWLRKDHEGLREAVEKTIKMGSFSKEDVQYQLAVLRKNLQSGDIKTWTQKAGLTENELETTSKVLCLHAGNLPLVGFQTALGVLLSGRNYYGKISKKDPYLLASFLKHMQSDGLAQEVKWSLQLEDFKGLKADAVVFAGSESSVPEVKREIRRLNAVGTKTKYLIRTAKLSVAYLNKMDEDTLADLAEGMIRYRGKGCRSIGAVISSFSLSEVRNELAMAIQQKAQAYAVDDSTQNLLDYQYAYNAAVEKEQVKCTGLLVEESDSLPDKDFSVSWIQGGIDELRTIISDNRRLIQSIYTTNLNIEGLNVESLSEAQSPPLYWKPDGEDVIEFLKNI